MYAKTPYYDLLGILKFENVYKFKKWLSLGNPGRLFVLSNDHPTELISQFVDYHLKPLVHKTASYIKDTTHFLNKLDQLGHLPSNAILVTLNISLLYTNILHNEGINAWLHYLNISLTSLAPPYALRPSLWDDGKIVHSKYLPLPIQSLRKLSYGFVWDN